MVVAAPRKIGMVETYIERTDGMGPSIVVLVEKACEERTWQQGLPRNKKSPGGLNGFLCILSFGPLYFDLAVIWQLWRESFSSWSWCNLRDCGHTEQYSDQTRHWGTQINCAWLLF
jgi:hypothetical protein